MVRNQSLNLAVEHTYGCHLAPQKLPVTFVLHPIQLVNSEIKLNAQTVLRNHDPEEEIHYCRNGAQLKEKGKQRLNILPRKQNYFPTILGNLWSVG